MKAKIILGTTILTIGLGFNGSVFGGATSTVFGKVDCGEWIKNQSDTKKAWVLGYLSGMNLIHSATGTKPEDPLGALNSMEQAFVWMDNYCQKNPLQRVSSGAQELFFELIKMKK